MSTEAAAWAARAENVWFAYRRQQWVLKSVDLAVPQGAFLTVLGPSGAGKTTLLKLLAGLLRPQKGRVELLGYDATRNGIPPTVRRRVGYIPQQLGLVRSLSALENVLMGSLGRHRGLPPLLGIFPRREVEQARYWLALLGIEHKASEPVYRLSGGERQRVAIARTLLQDPAIVFADEFVSDLDLPRAAEIIATVREIGQREAITWVFNLHELQLVQELGEDTLVVKDGTIVHQGPARELSWPRLQEALA